ncbi:MAG: glycosyltransferase family 4 protein [Planctomycetota bacterium]|nr:glycosyltransferase family 4 protein [Planctomycetota bacterium]
MVEASPLTLAHVDAETGFSGGEVQVFLLMEGLRERGHRNVLIAPPASRAEAIAIERGFETRPVRMRGDLDMASVVLLSGVLSTLRPDVVHLHTGRATWLGGLAARAAHCPAITTRRMDRRVKRGWRTRLVYGRLVEYAAAISPAVAAELIAGGVDAKKVVVVPSTIDPVRIRIRAGRDATRTDLGVQPHEILFVALASLVPRKGLDVLLDACADLAQRDISFACRIAGEGPEREPLARRGVELGLADRVRFLGKRDDVGDLLAACDAFVLPARREGLGVSALEAMAAGRAVVASRVGGLAEAVVDGGTGLLVPPDDAVLLADAMARVAMDAELRARLGAAGPARVASEFSPETMVVAYERIYREIVARRARRA